MATEKHQAPTLFEYLQAYLRDPAEARALVGMADHVPPAERPVAVPARQTKLI